MSSSSSSSSNTKPVGSIAERAIVPTLVQESEYDVLMEKNMWEYQDLLRYGQYNLQKFRSTDELKHTRVHLDQLEILSRYVFTVKSKSKNKTYNEGIHYLKFYMMRDDALEFKNIMKEHLEDAILLITDTHPDGHVRFSEIGKSSNNEFDLTRLPIDRNVFSHTPSEIISKLNKLITPDIDNEYNRHKVNHLVYVQLYSLNCRNEIYESLITYFVAFKDAPKQWNFERLLEYGRWTFDNYKTTGSGVLTQLYEDGQITRDKLDDIMEISKYAFVSDLTEVRPGDHPMDIRCYLPLYQARDLCKCLSRENQVYYIIRPQGMSEPCESYCDFLERDSSYRYYQKSEKSKESVDKKEKYTVWTDWLSEVDCDLPWCIRPVIENLTKSGCDRDKDFNPIVDYNQLACVYIETSNVKDSSLYSNIRKFFTQILKVK